MQARSANIMFPLFEILIGSCDNCLYVLDRTGKKIWQYETDFWIVAPPVVADLDNDGKKEIIIGSYDHNVYVLDSKGEYLMDYMPGINDVVNQNGSYFNSSIEKPAELSGKKLWQFEADDMIVGCAHIKEFNMLIITTKTGKVKTIKHQL
jgi:outer membrane protein assembly factor BamB